MTVYRLKMWLLTGLVISLSAATAKAQLYDWVDTPDHELQFFSPVDLDFDNTPIQRESGYTFQFEKVSWAYTGERITVGNRAITFNSQSIYAPGTDPNGDDVPNIIPQGPDDNLLPDPEPFTIVNGLNDVPPSAKFAFGSRYELGYKHKQHHWFATILDGPEITQFEEFGFGVGSNPLGFGSVHINFAAPFTYFQGFPDWIQNDMITVGTIDDITTPPDIARNIDDVNGNGVFDLGDTILILPVWEQVNVTNSTRTDGIELMHSYRLTNRHKMVTKQNNNLTVGAGVRYFRLRDRFRVDALGGAFGDSDWDTSIDNQIVGPQALVKWESQKNRWNLAVQGRFTAGYNITNWDQVARIGEQLIPSGQDRPVFADPTVSNHGRSDQEFSPLGELRVDASYQVTRSIAARVGYTAIYIDNLRRAASQVNYTLPNMGFIDGGTQDIFINGATFGFDVVY